jgi:hypothetical protein
VTDEKVYVPALVEQLGDKAKVLDGLTPKQLRFVEEYLVDMNATNAAKRAGYSEASACNQGYENLRKPAIVDAISAVMATRSERTTVNRSWVLAQLVDAHRVSKVKDNAAFLASRLKALELIGRHVDVRAFRAGLGFAGGGEEDDGRELWDLSRLSDDPAPKEWTELSEFELFERLLAKISIFQAHEGGARGADSAQAFGADSEAPRGDSGGL